MEWSSHPHPECWIAVNFQATTENSSLSTLLDYLKEKKKKKKITFSKSSFSLSFSPSLASMYFFEQCLRLGVIGTCSVCLPLQDYSLYVLPNCKSLWIKASAKWLNVNVNLYRHTVINNGQITAVPIYSNISCDMSTCVIQYIHTEQKYKRNTFVLPLFFMSWTQRSKTFSMYTKGLFLLNIVHKSV